jgi:hypothetical protein
MRDRDPQDQKLSHEYLTLGFNLAAIAGKIPDGAISPRIPDK